MTITTRTPNMTTLPEDEVMSRATSIAGLLVALTSCDLHELGIVLPSCAVANALGDFLAAHDYHNAADILAHGHSWDGHDDDHDDCLIWLSAKVSS
jgi:hypothetical protein